MSKFKSLCILFFSMFKIGLFTFGGGYAMISIFENEFVSKKKWLENDEFLDLIAISESTPGPIAINCSTYIGYKSNGLLGAIISTLAMCLPSFVIIFLISLFFNAFLEIEWIANAFKGIQVCVIYLIFSAGLKMFKQVKKNAFNIIIFIATIACTITFGFLSIKFSSIFYILIGAALGLILFTIQKIKNKNTTNKENK